MGCKILHTSNGKHFRDNMSANIISQTRNKRRINCPKFALESKWLRFACRFSWGAVGNRKVLEREKYIFQINLTNTYLWVIKILERHCNLKMTHRVAEQLANFSVSWLATKKFAFLLPFPVLLCGTHKLTILQSTVCQHQLCSVIFL